MVVKIDGDGQMDPVFIPPLVALLSRSDYVKGNRFFNFRLLRQMPLIRLFGNSILSFVNKLSSGYWNVMDPTNGFTAIRSRCLELLELERLDTRYFFESDMLFRLGTVRAVVTQLPIPATYGNESSSLSIARVSFEFPGKYLKCTLKRIFYGYFLRDFNLGSLQLITGGVLFIFGVIFGAWHWYLSALTGIPALTGTIMVAAVPLVLGFQLLLAFFQYDVSNVPQDPLTQAR